MEQVALAEVDKARGGKLPSVLFLWKQAVKSRTANLLQFILNGGEYQIDNFLLCINGKIFCKANARTRCWRKRDCT